MLENRPDEVNESKLNKLGNSISYQIKTEQKYLLGKILTCMESFIQDPEQRKSAKSILTEVYWECRPQNYNPIHYEIAKFLAQNTDIIKTDIELQEFIQENRLSPPTLEDYKRRG